MGSYVKPLYPRQYWDHERTLGDGLFAVTTADTDTVDNISLLGLVTQTASLVGARWAGSTVNHVELAVFPAPAEPVLASHVVLKHRFNRTERGKGNGGHPTASFCRAHRHICMRPSCGLRGREQRVSTSITKN